MPQATDYTSSPSPLSEDSRDWRNHSFFFWLGLGGTVGSFIGIFLSVYFYQAAQLKPELTFGVHPLKTELQRPDFDKELGFIYKGNLVESGSITSVQVSIWNAGTKSIRQGDILTPFSLVMPDGAAILSARVKKTTRAICEFERIDNQDDYKKGVCRLTWRILEPGDGAVLQLIYAGGAREDPRLEGTVEGQKDGTVVEHYSVMIPKNPVEDPLSWKRIIIIFSLWGFGTLLVFTPYLIERRTAAGRRRTEEIKAMKRRLALLENAMVPKSPVYLILIIVGLIMLVGGAIVFLMKPHFGPPFGW